MVLSNATKLGWRRKDGIYYFDPFSRVAKLNLVRFIYSLVANLVLPLYQRDVKIAFVLGDLHEEVYMELRPGMFLNDKKITLSMASCAFTKFIQYDKYA